MSKFQRTWLGRVFFTNQSYQLKKGFFLEKNTFKVSTSIFLLSLDESVYAFEVTNYKSEVNAKSEKCVINLISHFFKFVYFYVLVHPAVYNFTYVFVPNGM